MSATIMAKAPVGPTIWNLAPPNRQASDPATGQVIMPMLGATPDAIANVINNGNATTETSMPAFKSEKKVGSRENAKKILVRCFKWEF
jgi:hypothetical protein